VDAVAVGGWLVVASVVGSPPDERRWLVRFPPSDLEQRPARLAIPHTVVAFDVAELSPEPGPEIALLSARKLEIRSGPALASRRALRLDPPLPLPPRTRALSHMTLIGDWDGDGAPDVLLPGLGGARLLLLDGRPPRALSAALIGHYVTQDGPEELLDGWMRARIIWPEITRGDDDGDPWPDLFAVDRFGMAVFHGSASGPPSQPSRKLVFEPFSPEEERRHRSTWQHGFVTDLDGDGRTDLVLHRSVGTLLHSRTRTVVRLNPGTGLADAGAPAALLESSGAFATLAVLDLDGDGHKELVQTSVAFGIPQLLRLLVRRRVEAVLRVYRLDPRAPGGLRESFHTALSYRIDFDAARIRGILPSLAGDWNGDGLRDLLYGDGPLRARIRLGRPGAAGPDFGRASNSFTLPASEGLLVMDADRDGLDDLVLWSSTDTGGHVWRLRNRGVLPASVPVLRGARPGEEGSLE